MIEINLLPEELKAKLESKKKSVDIDLRYFIYLVPFVLSLLALVHIYLGVLIIGKNHQVDQLNKKWESLSAQRMQLEAFNKENISLNLDYSSIKKLTQGRVTWSEKLNKLSLSVPPGIWFTELSVAPPRDFTLKGTVVSLQKQEMFLIKKFIDSLKRDPEFFHNFVNLELGSVQRKTIGGFDVLDFALEGVLR